MGRNGVCFGGVRKMCLEIIVTIHILKFVELYTSDWSITQYVIVQYVSIIF